MGLRLGSPVPKFTLWSTPFFSKQKVWTERRSGGETQVRKQHSGVPEAMFDKTSKIKETKSKKGGNHKAYMFLFKNVTRYI